MKLEYVGCEQISARELFLLDAPDSSSVQGLPLLNSFVCLLAWNSEDSTVDEIAALATSILAAGCAYICCWGPRCELVHDIFDEVHVGFGEPQPMVISTWHPEEPLAEALWFALFAAMPDERREPCRAVVGISVANSSWAAEMRDAMRDPAAFSAAVYGNG